MADFGHAGTLTIRANKHAVVLSPGQKLRYSLKVLGAIPVFTFACEHKARLSAEEFPDHPKEDHEWIWEYPQDADGVDEVYTVLMSFVTATKYTLRVELLSANNNLIDTLKDLDGSSLNPADKLPAALEVIPI